MGGNNRGVTRQEVPYPQGPSGLHFLASAVVAWISQLPQSAAPADQPRAATRQRPPGAPDIHAGFRTTQSGEPHVRTQSHCLNTGRHMQSSCTREAMQAKRPHQNKTRAVTPTCVIVWSPLPPLRTDDALRGRGRLPYSTLEDLCCG